MLPTTSPTRRTFAGLLTSSEVPEISSPLQITHLGRYSGFPDGVCIVHERVTLLGALLLLMITTPASNKGRYHIKHEGSDRIKLLNVSFKRTTNAGATRGPNRQMRIFWENEREVQTPPDAEFQVLDT